MTQKVHAQTNKSRGHSVLKQYPGQASMLERQPLDLHRRAKSTLRHDDKVGVNFAKAQLTYGGT